MIKKKIFYEKHALQARFFMKKNAQRQTKCAAGRIFETCSDG
jgi:hypothetical protein